MFCIVSRAKTKDSHIIFSNTAVKSPQRKTKKIYIFFELKRLIYVEKLTPFSLFALYASDNLVHNLLQLGTFHTYYTNHKK